MKFGLTMAAVCVMTLLGGICAWALPDGGGAAVAEMETGKPVAEMAEVEQTVFLEGVEPVVGVPGEMMIEYEGTKEYYPVKSAKYLGERWVGDFEFPVLFYVYDAGYYQLGDVRVPRQERNPGLEGYEAALLQVMGLSGEDYVIEQVVWDGAAYDNDEGICCRNALARGRKRVEDYEVVYGGAVMGGGEILAGEPVTAQAMEEAEKPIPSRTDDLRPGQSFWQVVRRLLVITIAVWAAVLLLVLFVRAVRRKKRTGRS